MINRPPSPRELLIPFPLVNHMRDAIQLEMSDDYKYMQEALTVEWLIEQGLMPDYYDFDRRRYIKGPWWTTVYWYCEDKTQ